ncbi:MAG: hypothetical protein ACYS0G_04230 [Planctomycetota bacterium]|jgi:hypothetical protein
MNGKTRLIILAATAALGGCAPSHAPGAAGARSEAPSRTQTGDVLGRLLGAGHGLEVRQWVVADDTVRIATALLEHQDGQGFDAGRAAVLRGNGLRLVRVRADRADALLEALGIASLDLTAWYGQIFEWRELQHQTIGRDGLAVAVDGRVERFGSGRLRLMARSWTVQMEDGLYLNLELLPQFQTAPAAKLNRLLGNRGTAGRLLTSVALGAKLEAGFAYVLTGESPSIEWRPDGVAATAPPIGPRVVGPATVGELLFCGRRQPRTRGMLVFIPKLPAPWTPRDLAPDGIRVRGAAPD